MATWTYTNRGKKVMLNSYFRADTTDTPAAFSVRLVTSAAVATVDTALFSSLTEISTGNGYTTGTGVAVTRDSTGWPTVAQNDSPNTATIQMKDIVITASGGTIPASGNPINQMVLVDDEASPQVLAFYTFASTLVLADTTVLTFDDPILTLA